MQVLMNLALLLQMVAAVAMIGLVLVQHGKGADMGASFGGGSSGSLFGATGSANFLSRSTAVAASVFFVCTLALAYFGHTRVSAGPEGGTVLDRAAAPVVAASAASEPGAAQIPGLVASPAPAVTEAAASSTPAAVSAASK